MPLNLHSFPKQERLKSRKIISHLFKGAHSFSAYPLRPVWHILPAADLNTVPSVQFAFTVPKKSFPHAVDRNRLRRQMREAFRLQKHLLIQGLAERNDSNSYAMMLLYTAKEPLPYETIAASIQKIIRKFLAWKIDKNPPASQNSNMLS